MPIESIWQNYVLPKQLKEQNIDVFDSQWGGGLPLKKNKKPCRYITTIHDTIPLDMERDVSCIRQFAYRRYIQLSHAACGWVGAANRSAVAGSDGVWRRAQSDFGREVDLSDRDAKSVLAVVKLGGLATRSPVH